MIAPQLLQEFKSWCALLDEREQGILNKQLTQRRRREVDIWRAKLQMSDRDWKCTHCRSKNGIIYYRNAKQIPSSRCRCCGSSKREGPLLHEFHLDDSAISSKHITLDQRIVKEWSKLLSDIEQSPTKNKCDGADSLIIDVCPMIQKFFFVMKYYHIYIGKEVVNIDDDTNYQICSVSDLVENLQGLSLVALVDMFGHISTVHRARPIFAHFIKNIGQCHDGAACRILMRNRNRAVTINSKLLMENEEKSDAVEQTEKNIISFFDKWHSFLFHPKLEEHVAAMDSFVDEPAGKSDSMPKNISREYSSKYVDYRFGVWIDYTVNSPFFASMKQEMTENDICTLTSDQWQSTMMKALTHLDSEKIKGGERYKAKRTDKKYGIDFGKTIGTENVMAILIYCNYTDLQRHFTETFCKMNIDETEEMIMERHCRNYYWLGRYVVLQTDSILLDCSQLSNNLFFRALFIAIHFYGERMTPKTVVWHGVSRRMKFESFATFFECPTSTSTEQEVAVKFSGSDGMILKLKSKFNRDCSTMLDVSTFSNYPAECERLFVKEALIISDVMMRIDEKWTQFGLYFEALVFFEVCCQSNRLNNLIKVSLLVLIA